MNNIDFFTSGATLSAPVPAIYCLASLQPRCIYIGQTNSNLGVLGRFSQHLSETNSNTFKQRIMSLYKYDEFYHDIVYGTFFQLPDSTRYTDRASDYREAVEGLVQSKIINIASEKKFTVISRVNKNSLCKKMEIQQLAESAVEKFYNFIKDLQV